MTKFQTITVPDMKTLLQDEAVMLLDCRKLQDYRAGHIENAMFVHEDLKESLLKKADKTKKLIIDCYHGHSSEHLAEMFADFGYKNVFSLQDGYEQWQQQTTAQSH
ncbi:MAG: rhodanese-like domain-containing protein [Gammaproteobacteria bacterium]|nr:rhodanese-like domain-containing protein [Gammaproteobacteria bacterium]